MNGFRAENMHLARVCTWWDAVLRVTLAHHGNVMLQGQTNGENWKLPQDLININCNAGTTLAKNTVAAAAVTPTNRRRAETEICNYPYCSRSHRCIHCNGEHLALSCLKRLLAKASKLLTMAEHPPPPPLPPPSSIETNASPCFAAADTSLASLNDSPPSLTLGMHSSSPPGQPPPPPCWYPPPQGRYRLRVPAAADPRKPSLVRKRRSRLHSDPDR